MTRAALSLLLVGGAVVLGVLAILMVQGSRPSQPEPVVVTPSALPEPIVVRSASPGVAQPRAAVEDAADRVARAQAARDVFAALGMERAPALDPRLRQWFEQMIEESRRSAESSLQSGSTNRGAFSQPEHIRALKAERGLAEIEATLQAYRAGDYFVDVDFAVLKALEGSGEFVASSYKTTGLPLVGVIRRRDDPAIARLNRAIQVEEFNAMPESRRRRVLEVRAKDLTDPDVDRRWLGSYFPKDVVIDPVTATIR